MSARRILLIDNDTEFQTRLQENLAPYGFEVYVADEDPASLQSVTDLGPEGGERGGKLLAAGTPEELMKVRASATGQWLKREDAS